MRAARAAAFHEHRASYGLWVTHSRAARIIYLPESRAAHRQRTAVRVREARGAQPEKLLAASLMLTARSEATSTAVYVERLRATGRYALRDLRLVLVPI